MFLERFKVLCDSGYSLLNELFQPKVSAECFREHASLPLLFLRLCDFLFR
jgi:hypothetical protein